jgi:glycosyltransferase involved in cell wall biosynthesis
MRKSAVLVVPGRLDLRTGGYIYDRRIVDGLRAKGWTVRVHSLDDSFPRPAASALTQAGEVFDSLPEGTITLVDSLACGAIPEILEHHRSRLHIVALVHLPLAADVGLDTEDAARFAASERRAYACADRVVVTGRAALLILGDYGVPSSRVVVIEPGTDPAPVARGSNGGPLQLLSVATLNPGKGHEDLLTALAAVPGHDWQLTCAGSVTRYPQTAARIRAIIRERELEDRVSLAGELDAEAVAEQYDRSDVFVLATLRETYGMAIAEALARGLPVVSTLTGAIPDLVGTEAGLLVPPGDVRGLGEALSRCIGDADLRARLAAGARRVRARLPRWDETVAKMAATLEALAHG